MRKKRRKGEQQKQEGGGCVPYEKKGIFFSMGKQGRGQLGGKKRKVETSS